MKKLMRRLLGFKQPQSVVMFGGPGRALAAPKDYSSFSREGYQKNVIAFNAINIVADAVGKLDWNLYERVNRKELKEIPEHPLLDLLDRPNSMQGREQFFKSLIGFILISGNGYIYANGPERGQPPTELWIFRPDRMKVIPGPTFGTPAGYVRKVGMSQEETYKVELDGRSPICHLKTFNPLEDWYGMSPIQAAAFNIDQVNEMNAWNLALLKNGARPSGALIVKPGDDNEDGELTQEQRDDLRRQLKEQYTASGEKGTPLLLEAGMEWKEMGFSPKDMDWIKGDQSNGRKIGNVFGVPSQILGIPGDSTYANYEQANLAFHQMTVLGWAGFIRSYINNWLVPAYQTGEGVRQRRLWLNYDIDSIEALLPLRREKWNMANKATWLTDNEKREMTGYGKYEVDEEPGNQILVNAGLLPLEQAIEELEDEEGETDPSDFEEEEEEEEGDAGKNANLPDLAIKPGESFSFIDGKLFNLGNDNARRRFVTEQVKKRARFEKRFRTQVNAAFRKEGQLVAEAVDGIDERLIDVAVEEAIEEASKFMEKVYRKNITQIMKSFGADVLDLEKGFRGMETKDSRSDFDRFLKEFIDNHVGERVRGIKRTSRKRVIKRLRRVLDEALLEEGDTVPEIAKEVEKTYKGFTKARSHTIARTETHNASNVAQRQAAKALDIPNLQKEWLSALDMRTRRIPRDSADHVMMNKVKVGLEEQFSVPSEAGADLMDGPGDPQAPARQNINCRCTLTYSTSKN